MPPRAGRLVERVVGPRMSANSVLPPVGGMWRADRSNTWPERLEELSNAKSWLAQPERRRRRRAPAPCCLVEVGVSFRSMLMRRLSAAMSPVAARAPQAAAETTAGLVIFWS